MFNLLLKLVVAIRDAFWPFLSDWLKAAWVWAGLPAIAVILALFGLSAYQRYWAEGKGDIEDRLAREKMARDLVNSGKFLELFRDESGIVLERKISPTNSVPAAQVFGRRILKGRDSVDVEIIAINNGLFFERNKTLYISRTRQQADLAEVLRQLAAQGTFDSSQDFICLGLASYNSKNGMLDLQLTKDRAVTICSDLSSALERPSRLWAVALGSSNLSPENDIQRSAVILGVNGGPYFAVQENMQYLIRTSSVPGIPLDGYRFSAQPVYAEFRLEGVQWPEQAADGTTTPQKTAWEVFTSQTP